MSITALREPKEAHDILDDFESIYWLLSFICFHHFAHEHLFKRIQVNLSAFDVFDASSIGTNMIGEVPASGPVVPMLYGGGSFRSGI